MKPGENPSVRDFLGLTTRIPLARDLDQGQPGDPQDGEGHEHLD
jgi:hypothetical protein